MTELIKKVRRKPRFVRDLTKAQFDRYCAERGFKPHGILGYYNLGVSGSSVSVSIHNAGRRRRQQLAFLIRERERADIDREIQVLSQIVQKGIEAADQLANDSEPTPPLSA